MPYDPVASVEQENGSEKNDAEKSPETRSQWWLRVSDRRMRFVCFVFGILVPVNCFIASAREPVSPDVGELWQDGSLSTYFTLMLSCPSVIPFYPFYILSAVCMALWCFRPDRFAGSAVVRFGIYSGIILAIQAAVLLYGPPETFMNVLWMIGISLVAFLIGVLVLWAVVSLVFFGFDKLTPIGRKWAILLALTCFIIHAALLALVTPPPGFSAIIVIVPGIFSPFLALFVYAYASRSIYVAARQPFRFSLLRIMGVTTWASAYFAAWRGSVQLMLIEYNKLPTEDTCFVCSAAAHGHPALVGSFEVQQGSIVRANRQMQVLKTGEFVFQVAMPGLHRLVRKVYNRTGPQVASVVAKRRWLASLAFLMFKPLEVIVGVAIRILKIERRLIRKLYR